jgi:hypothetical protein
VTVVAAGSLGAGSIAFLVVLALVVASVFLFRSMSKHIRKVPKSFDDRPTDDVSRRPPGPGGA